MKNAIDGILSGIVVGVDEVNFSPSLAGDCGVAAVWLPPELLSRATLPVNDSKVLSHEGRIKAFSYLLDRAVFAFQPASVADIAKFGIYEARNIAALSALDALAIRLKKLGFAEIDHVVCDSSLGHGLSDSKWKDKLVVIKRAGKKSFVVAAASVIAKVYNDALFCGWGAFWPGYGMERDHGSLSIEHRKALAERGPSPVHRRVNYAPKWWASILGGNGHGG